jgi:hypothetical protein
MDKLSKNDVEQLYLGCLLRYKGDIVKVYDVLSADEVEIFKLASQESVIVPFIQSDFTPIAERIGFVNDFPNGVAYISRQPKRLFSVGITSNNTRITLLAGILLPRHIVGFTSLAIVDAINNKYPSLSQALKIVSKESRHCAFDKQFAIDSNRNIYFKSRGIVGYLPKPYRSKERIVWKYGAEMYQFLLEPRHAKTVRTFEL